MARQGLSQGSFEDNDEDTGSIIEEFFPEQRDSPGPAKATAKASSHSLADKLKSRHTVNAGPATPPLCTEESPLVRGRMPPAP